MKPTSLGLAMHKSNFDIDMAQFYVDELRKVQEGLVLSCDLHLLFIITPFEQVMKFEVSDWSRFYQMVIRLEDKEQQVADMIGLPIAVIQDFAKGNKLLPKEKLSAIAGDISKWTQFLSTKEGRARRRVNIQSSVL